MNNRGLIILGKSEHKESDVYNHLKLVEAHHIFEYLNEPIQVMIEFIGFSSHVEFCT